ncbi:MAG: dephospho-CoA kinase [Dehalococcoidia bacterium]|nr:dephospho-CoA kinase [Dehalococcoidia bacterium]
MLIIGLTGNLGTGKTEVAQKLAELGAVVINADELGHELLQPRTQTYTEIVDTFGKSIVGRNREIDRKKLGQIVFADAAALNKLNRIMHPRIYNIVNQKIDEYRRSGAGVVVLEAALLIEAGWRPLLDQVWVTIAPEAIVAERLRRARGLSEEQFLARLRTQMPQKEKAKLADVVIDTDCTMGELRARVTELWKKLPAGKSP